MKTRWIYLFVRVDCFNKVRFYRHLVELVFVTFGGSFMICMVGDHEDDEDSLWRLFKRKANRFGCHVASSELEPDAISVVFDDPFAWEGPIGGRAQRDPFRGRRPDGGRLREAPMAGMVGRIQPWMGRGAQR